MKEVKLGDRAKDKITGFSGIVVARSEWLNGCKRFEIQPEELKDGKIIESDWFDTRQVVLVKAGIVKLKEPREGPMKNPSMGMKMK